MQTLQYGMYGLHSENPKHDASYKNFFTHPRTVADTLRAANMECMVYIPTEHPPHDASYKNFFTHPRTVADTLRAAAGDIARHLDFAYPGTHAGQLCHRASRPAALDRGDRYR